MKDLAHVSIKDESSESAMLQRRPYRPALTESPIVTSRITRSTAIETEDEGADAERVSVRAIQTTRDGPNVNNSPSFL